MKIILRLFILLVSFSGVTARLQAQQIGPFAAAIEALQFWNTELNEGRGLQVEPVRYADTTTAWLIVSPEKKFVIISADSMLRPVLAYGDSLTGLSNERLAAWKKLFASDFYGRLRAIADGKIPSEKPLWNKRKSTLFQQWPPEGSTTTGGWLYTNWTQTSPYNKLCPMDLNAGSRSVVGCPATAMAQIFNYNRSLNYTRFDDADDYYHSYGSGNQYWIDNDYATRSFPSFPELNHWLDTLETSYSQGLPVTDTMKAALSFAAGVAAHQVYTASVSGTFGIDQAQMAILRFGFDQAELLMPPDTSINRRVADDMKNAMPAQLGLVDAGNTVGHNVVIDGYNTDEFYHFNFGWGGSANGWYTLPPTSIPYNLTVIEGVVVQIRSTYAGINMPAGKTPTVRFIYGPGSDINITGLTANETYLFRLISASGAVVTEKRETAETGKLTVAVPGTAPGVYLCSIRSAEKTWSGKIIIL